MSGLILNSVAVFGLVLIVMGVIASFMFIFGIGKVKVGGKNILHLKIAAMEIVIETGRIYFAIVLGLILAITPVPISAHFGEAGELAARDEATPMTSQLEEGGHAVSKEEISINLSKRKELGIEDFLGGHLSEVEWLVRRTIRDVESGIKEVHFRHATSGYAIEVMDKPEGIKWRKTEEKGEVIYNPFYGLLMGKKSVKSVFKDLIARKGKMKTYYITAAITDKREQEMVYKLKYYNAFQGKGFEWAGKVFSANTDILTMHITFPEDKPFKSLDTYKREVVGADLEPINNPEIKTGPDKRTLTWTIRDAKKGEIYYIKWLW